MGFTFKSNMTQRLDRDGIETHSDNSIFIKAITREGGLEASHNLIPPTIKHSRIVSEIKSKARRLKPTNHSGITTRAGLIISFPIREC